MTYAKIWSTNIFVSKTLLEFHVKHIVAILISSLVDSDEITEDDIEMYSVVLEKPAETFSNASRVFRSSLPQGLWLLYCIWVN